MDEICRVSNCDNPSGKKGLCTKHYQWLRRHGELAINESETLTIKVSQCSLDGCDRNVVSIGLCSAHYQRQYHYGDPKLGKMLKSADERFWEKVEKTESCWLWRGKTDEYGKGRFALDGKMKPAHRYSYQRHHGVTLSTDEMLRQTCGVPECVNPDHLRLASELKVSS